MQVLRAHTGVMRVGGKGRGRESNNFSGNDISDQEIGMPAGLVGNNSSLITSFGRRESHGNRLSGP